MLGVAGVIGLWGGVAEIGGRPGLIATIAGPGAPGTKTFAFGLKINSFAFGFIVDFFAAAEAAGGVDAGGELAWVPS
jgi:hypothetical protein